VQQQRAYTDLGIKSTGTKQRSADVEKAQQWMCENFYPSILAQFLDHLAARANLGTAPNSPPVDSRA